MDNKYTKILMAIILVIILIIILTIFLILNMIDNPEHNEINNNVVEEEINSAIEEEIVTEKIEYYTVRNCINSYLNYLNENSSIYYIGGEKNIDIQKETIYNLLSSNYIKSKKIEMINVLDNVGTISEQQIFIPLQMKVLKKENINKYVAYGIIQTIDNNFIKEQYFIVDLDKNNKTFSIEPLEKQNLNIDEIEIKNNNISINNNDTNSYEEAKVTDEYVTREYFILYKKLVRSKPEIIYNMMSEEYRQLRFGALDDFKKYINDNIEEIKTINLKQYLVNNYDNYTEYVGKDQFGNLYIFNENSQQELDIKIDTYTVSTDKFIKEYENAIEKKRVQMNIDKFIQMINRHDYKNAYKCISEGFRNNYFPTQLDFENTIKNNFFKYNKFEFKNFEKKGANVFVCTTQLTDLTNESKEVRDINIIMKLNDGLDFEMSFGM